MRLCNPKFPIPFQREDDCVLLQINLYSRFND